MFRAIAITLAAAAALSAGFAQAGGGCSSKGSGYGGHNGGYNVGYGGGYVDHHESHYEQRPHYEHRPQYVEQVYTKPACAKPVHVEPIYVKPHTSCYFKLCYKLPCWDYQKDMTFDDLDEAKEMARMLQANGYRIALLKVADHGHGNIGGKFDGGHNHDDYADRDYGRGDYEVSYSKPRGQQNSNYEVLFRGEGREPSQGRGQPISQDFLLD